MKTHALVLHQTGKPNEAIRYEEWSLPELQPNQVLIEMKAAPINPADINIAEGTYPLNQELPIVIGNEGAGIVREVGSAVQKFNVGQTVFPIARLGCWSEHRVLNEEEVYPVPAEIPIEQAAMLLVNPPTAWLMLQTIVQLNPEDWVVQNVANSVVGRYVIHFANHLGYKTVNVVRREELVEPLKSEGADIVITDHVRFSQTIKQETGSGNIPLGLNAVGGQSASEIAKTISDHGTLVTYGAMGRQPLEISNSLLIFKDIRFVGFWLRHWIYQARPEEIRYMFDQILPVIIERNIHIPIAQTYPLNDWQTALEHANEGARGGKVMFRMP